MTKEQRRFDMICQREIAPRAREADLTGTVPSENLKVLSEHGFMGLFHPTSVGGSAADGTTLAAAMESVAKACASTFWMTTISSALSGKLLWTLAKSDHQAELLHNVVKGKKIGCVAGTEGSGSDQRSEMLDTVITKTAQGYKLTGVKPRVSNAPVADFALVLARLDKAIASNAPFAFALVDLRQSGLKRKQVPPLMGLRALPWGKLEFDDVKLDPENVFLSVDMAMLVQAIEWGLLIQSYCSLGLAQAALDACLEFVESHHAFDRPIAHLPIVHARLADMYAEIDTARVLNLRACDAMARGRPATQDIRLAKIHATEMGVRVADWAMRISAGRGYSTGLPIERIYRDMPGNIPAGQTPDRLRELLICEELGADPWSYEPFDWLGPAGLTLA